MQFSDARSRDAIITAIAIITAVFSWMAFEIPKGTLSSNADEMATGERSREMLLLGRSEVHFNFKPSFEKPPLQYWLTSLSLPLLENKTLAVRIWPWFYGVLTVVAVAFLTAAVAPDRPWVVPLSVAILTSFPLFLAEACRGMLDTGLALFTTATILFSQLARRNPAWWLGTAIACLLGSLQKIPVPFLVWLFILAFRFTSPAERNQLKSRWLWLSVIGTVITMLIWPVSQILTFEVPFRSLFQEEVVDWLGPENLGARPYLELPYRLIIASSSGFFIFAAPFAILFWKKEKFAAAAREISIVCLALMATEILFNFREIRYIGPIIPALCLLFAVVAEQILRYRGFLCIAAIPILAILLLLGFVQTKIRIDSRRGKDFADQKRVAEELGTLQRPDLRTVLVKAVKVGRDVPILRILQGTDLHFTSFYLFHGNLRFPVETRTVDEIREAPPSPPIVGVCMIQDLPVIRASYPEVKVQFTRAQFILWTVDDLKNARLNLDNSKWLPNQKDFPYWRQFRDRFGHTDATGTGRNAFAQKASNPYGQRISM